MNLNRYVIYYYRKYNSIYRIRQIVITAQSRDKAIKHFKERICDGIIENVIEYPGEKEEKKVDLTKKITVSFTEDDIKEIVAEYVKNNANIKGVTAENVELVYGVKYSGPQMDRVEHGYLKECKVKA